METDKIRQIIREGLIKLLASETEEEICKNLKTELQELKSCNNEPEIPLNSGEID